MCFACELLNWKMYQRSAFLPSPHWFLLNTILFFLSVATVSMFKWDVQMWYMRLNQFWSSLIIHSAQEKFGNDIRPDSQQPLPTHWKIHIRAYGHEWLILLCYISHCVFMKCVGNGGWESIVEAVLFISFSVIFFYYLLVLFLLLNSTLFIASADTL